MKKVLLDVDTKAFDNKPTPCKLVNNIVVDEEACEVTARYIFIDDDLNVCSEEKKYVNNKKTSELLKDQMRSLYAYLIFLHDPVVSNQLDNNIDALSSVKADEIIQKIKICISLGFAPVLTYSVYNFNKKPFLYSALAFISVCQILKGVSRISVLNELKEKYSTLVEKTDDIFFTEGPKLVRKKGNLNEKESSNRS